MIEAASTPVVVVGRRDSEMIARLKKGDAPRLELSTRMSVICIVNGSNSQSPR